MGSKSRIAKCIVPILQKCIDDNGINTYIEPFCGGCNIIDKIRCSNRIANDVNPYLIALFQHLQTGGELPTEVSRTLYSKVRAEYKNNAYEPWFVGAVGFLASYNGRWFDGGYAQPGWEKNKNGKPVRYRDYYQEAKKNIESQTTLLKDVTFHCQDYKKCNIPDNSLIYCDPPYCNTKQFANAMDFDYEIFWQQIREWSIEHFVVTSELNAPSDFECIWEKECSRSIKANDKSIAVEKLFIYNKGKSFNYLHNTEVNTSS